MRGGLLTVWDGLVILDGGIGFFKRSFRGWNFAGWGDSTFWPFLSSPEKAGGEGGAPALVGFEGEPLGGSRTACRL